MQRDPVLKGARGRACHVESEKHLAALQPFEYDLLAGEKDVGEL